MVVTDDYRMLNVRGTTCGQTLDTRPFVKDDDALRPGMAPSPDLALFNEKLGHAGMVYTTLGAGPERALSRSTTTPTRAPTPASAGTTRS